MGQGAAVQPGPLPWSGSRPSPGSLRALGVSVCPPCVCSLVPPLPPWRTPGPALAGLSQHFWVGPRGCGVCLLHHLWLFLLFCSAFYICV